MPSPNLTTYVASWYVTTDYGAIGDGTALDAFAIQRTMRTASEAGGGLVILPRGTYYLESSLDWSGLTNVCLWLQTGSTLTGPGTLPAASGTNNSIFDFRNNAGGGAAGYPVNTTGLTGATDGARFVGGTTAGAPTTGTFAKGDFAVDETGSIWVCTTEGSPGTWQQLAANQYPGPAVTGVAASTPLASSGGTTPTISLPPGNAITQTAPITGTVLTASGTSGNTLPARLIGATLNGKPTTGVYLKGDVAVDESGSIWVCTEGGTDAAANWVQLAGNTNTASPVTGVGASTPLSSSGGTTPVVSLPPTNDIIQSTGRIMASSFGTNGLVGSDATAATRYIGAKINGKPLVGSFTAGDFSIDQTGSLWICTTGGTDTAAVWQQMAANTVVGSPVTGVSATTPLASSGGTTPTISLPPGNAITQTAAITGTVLAASGAAGSNQTAGARFIGATTNGKPTVGSFTAGDFSIDQTGSIWVCTAGGTNTAATWVQMAGNTVVGSPVTGVAASTPLASTGGTTPTISLPPENAITQTAPITGETIKASGLTGAVSVTRYVGGTPSVAPTSGTWSTGDWVVTLTGKMYVCTAGGTGSGATWVQVGGSGGSGGGTVTGVTATTPLASSGGNAPVISLPPGNAITQTAAITGTVHVASGLANSDATAASRYIGAKANGKPLVGTFAKGDFSIDQTGSLWICTTGGTDTAAVWQQMAANTVVGSPVTGVAATAPLASSGGTTPTISLPPGNAITQTAPITGTVLTASGITGSAVSGARWIGSTSSVPPTTGTFLVGDWITTLNGKIYVCITAGVDAAAAWVQVGAGSTSPQVISRQYLTSAATSVVFTSIPTTYNDLELRVYVRGNDSAAVTLSVGTSAGAASLSWYDYHEWVNSTSGGPVALTGQGGYGVGGSALTIGNMGNNGNYWVTTVPGYRRSGGFQTIRTYSVGHTSGATSPSLRPYSRITNGVWGSGQVTSLTVSTSFGSQSECVLIGYP